MTDQILQDQRDGQGKEVRLLLYVPFTSLSWFVLNNGDHRYQSRAFLLLPMTFNIGVIIGPILGGLLSDPAGSYPDLFGDVEFFRRFPYAAPNLVSAFFLFSAMLGVWLCLEEARARSHPIVLSSLLTVSPDT
jgi:MFS family permease